MSHSRDPWNPIHQGHDDICSQLYSLWETAICLLLSFSGNLMLDKRPSTYNVSWASYLDLVLSDPQNHNTGTTEIYHQTEMVYKWLGPNRIWGWKWVTLRSSQLPMSLNTATMPSSPKHVPMTTRSLSNNQLTEDEKSWRGLWKKTMLLAWLHFYCWVCLPPCCSTILSDITTQNSWKSRCSSGLFQDFYANLGQMTYPALWT